MGPEMKQERLKCLYSSSVVLLNKPTLCKYGQII